MAMSHNNISVNFNLHLLCAHMNQKAYSYEANVQSKKFKNLNIVAFKGTNNMKSHPHPQMGRVDPPRRWPAVPRP